MLRLKDARYSSQHGIKVDMLLTTRTWKVVLEDVPILLNLLEPLPSIIDLPSSMNQKLFENIMDIMAHFKHLNFLIMIGDQKHQKMNNYKNLKNEVIIALL